MDCVVEWLNVCRMVYGCVEFCGSDQNGAARVDIYREKVRHGWD